MKTTPYEFNEYMERFWERFKPAQRQLVETDPLYNIHCLAKDCESAAGRATDILKRKKFLKEAIANRAWQEHQKEIASL